MAMRHGHFTEEISVTPSGWTILELGAIGTFKNGINKDGTLFGRGYPFVNLMDVFGVNAINSNENLGLIDTNSAEQSVYNLCEGDVLFIRSSVKPSGVGLTAVIEAPLPKTVYSGFLIRYRDNGALDKNFKKHCFYENGFRRRIIAASSVSANTNINQDSLKRIVIAVPPKNEQINISSALDSIDVLIDKLNQVIAKKRDIRQATMQQLLPGKTRLPGYSGKWEEKKLNEISKINIQTLGSETTKDYSFKYISLEDVDFGVLRSYSDQKFSTAPSRARRMLKNNDVLISSVRPNLKSHLLFTEQSNDWICSTGFSVVRCDINVANPEFVFHHLFSGSISKQIDALVTGSNYPSLNSSDVRNLTLPCPSVEEQFAIAEVLSSMGNEITAIVKQLNKLKLLKQGMMQELLTGRIRLI